MAERISGPPELSSDETRIFTSAVSMLSGSWNSVRLLILDEFGSVEINGTEAGTFRLPHNLQRGKVSLFAGTEGGWGRTGYTIDFENLAIWVVDRVN